MLLELTALIAGINTAAATIKKCAEAGQDISSIAGMIQKLGSSEVQITKLQNSGALSPEEALKATLAKKELQDHMQQIKDLFVLSGNGHLYSEMIENMVAARKAEQALEPVSLNPSGRPMATGDFDTREALVENVLKDFNSKYKTGQWTRQNIADRNGISYSALTLLLRDAKAI